MTGRLGRGIQTPVAAVAQTTKFPTGAPRHRVRQSVERALGKIYGLFLVPTTGAFVGTAYSVSHPSEVIHHGLVVAVPSTWDVLLGALLGGVVGLVLVAGIIAVWSYGVYLVRGDPVWQAGYGDAAPDEHNPMMYFELRCRSRHAVDPSTLGSVDCMVKTPSGATWSSKRIVQGHDGARLMLNARFPFNPEPGRYRCRWYSGADGDRLVEVARATIPVTVRGGGGGRLEHMTARRCYRPAQRCWAASGTPSASWDRRPDDSFRPRAGAKRTIALATERSSRSSGARRAPQMRTRPARVSLSGPAGDSCAPTTVSSTSLGECRRVRTWPASVWATAGGQRVRWPALRATVLRDRADAQCDRK